MLRDSGSAGTVYTGPLGTNPMEGIQSIAYTGGLPGPGDQNAGSNPYLQQNNVAQDGRAHAGAPGGVGQVDMDREYALFLAFKQQMNILGGEVQSVPNIASHADRASSGELSRAPTEIGRQLRVNTHPKQLGVLWLEGELGRPTPPFSPL